ncbi:hypothetical protein M9Y10_022172 [Tritrichomonas musculus]|uniref:Importin N-terminal domain-containing protein n=1 Tax=Tritrichomonas musculus TaxID=1915356 RepID=A0ABR2KRS0_9EUKA
MNEVDLSTPESLQVIIDFLQMGMDPQNQALFIDNLSQIESNSMFIFALIKVISNQDVAIPIRVVATSLLRHNFFKIPNNLVDDFLQAVDQNLFYSLQIPISNLVNEIAVLTAEIYQNFKYYKRTNISIFPDLNQKLTETIQIPEYVENSLIFAIEFANVDYNIGSTFLTFLPNFVIGQLSEYSLHLASLLPLHSNKFKETIVPIIFSNVNELTEKSLSFACVIVGNILRDSRDQILIDFIVECMNNASDSVAFHAADSIYQNEMISYQESIVVALFKRLGNDFNLCESNVSTFYMKVLKYYYTTYIEKAHPFLLLLINQSLESKEVSESQMRCAIRCYSILRFEKETDVENLFIFLSKFLNTTFCCDASYAITKITKKYPSYYPQTFQVIFQGLNSDSHEIRYQLLNYLTNLSFKIFPRLSEDVKNSMPCEPYLESLLQMIVTRSSQSDYEDEFVVLLRLVASFCNIVQSFDQGNLSQLIQMTFEIINQSTTFSVECLNIFGSIIYKEKDCFQQLFQLVQPIVTSLLFNNSDDVNILQYALNFFAMAVIGANRFQFISDEFNGLLLPVCIFTFSLIDPFSQVSSCESQNAGWLLFYRIILYDAGLFDNLKVPLINLLRVVNKNKYDLKLIGIKCQFVLVLIDSYQQLLDFELKKDLICICYLYLVEDIWDGDFYRQVCMLCLLKLSLITPEYSLDAKVIDDAKLMIEYINDPIILKGITDCLQNISQSHE